MPNAAVSDVTAVSKSRTRVLVKNGVIIDPTAFTCTATPASRAASARPGRQRLPSASPASCRAPASAARATTARRPSPADCPRASPPGRSDPAGDTRSIRSARPPYAATGKPPPMILPRHVRSGRDAVDWPARRPARGGSRSSPRRRSAAMPSRSHSVRRPARKPGSGATVPMLPATGSMITAAICPGFAAASVRPTRDR